MRIFWAKINYIEAWNLWHNGHLLGWLSHREGKYTMYWHRTKSQEDLTERQGRYYLRHPDQFVLEYLL